MSSAAPISRPETTSAEKPAIDAWIAAGVKDSKKIADAQILRLDDLIRRTPGVVVETCFSGMTKYNELMGRPGANLNRLLAWQHATALNAADSYAGNAKSYFGAHSATNVSARYSTWFGAVNATRYTTGKNHFDAIQAAFATKPITVDCGCKKTYYAYVYPTQPYKIYVCKAFWSAPVTGTDSRAGTLIHEMSHFNVVAGTDDHVYGQSGAKSLAISNPDNALDNADNHEYFSENTPAQN